MEIVMINVRIIFLLFLAFASLDARSEKKFEKIATTQFNKAKYYYFEVPPNEKKQISIQAIKCDPSKDELRVNQFESVSKVVDGQVNAVNIFVDAGHCKNSPLSSVWTRTINIENKALWTHLRLVLLSDNIMLFN